MTTTELIHELQKFPPDTRAAVWDAFNDCATLDVVVDGLMEVTHNLLQSGGTKALLITNG